MRPNKEMVRRHCKEDDLIPSSLRQGSLTLKERSSIIKRRRPKSKDLIIKLQEVVREYLEDRDDFGVNVLGDFSSWVETKELRVETEEEENRIEFSIDFKYVSYT